MKLIPAAHTSKLVGFNRSQTFCLYKKPCSDGRQFILLFYYIEFYIWK